MGASTRDTSLQVDVTRTVAGFRLETGARAEQRLIGTDLVRESYGGSGLTGGENAFDYDTRIFAGYLQASRPFGPVTVQAGLRAEHADTRFDLLTESETYDTCYSSLYPSASAVMELGQRRSIRLGYPRRVRRPRTQQLNPVVLQTDSLSLRAGNPSLRPQYTSSFDLTLQTGGSLGTLRVTPFYRVTTDLIQYYKTVDPGTGISTTTFRLFDRRSQYGLDVTATGRVGSRLRGMLGTHLAQVSTNAENLEAGLLSSALSWSVRSSATLDLAASADLQGFVMYRAPREIEPRRCARSAPSGLSGPRAVLRRRAAPLLPRGGESDASATDVNIRGQVAVWREVTCQSGASVCYEAAVWENGQFTPIPAQLIDPIFYRLQMEINDRGHVVGAMGPGPNHRAFLWDGSSVVDLGYGHARGLNNKDQVVGLVPIEAAVDAALWENGRLVRTASLASPHFSGANAINQRGQIAGSGRPMPGPPNHAFIWVGDQLTSLGLGPSSARDINARGQIAGTLTGDGSHAFLWTNGSISLLDEGVGVSSGATAVNNRGQVVGTMNDGELTRAVMWNKGSLVVLGQGESQARGMNNKGDVAGNTGDGTPGSLAILWKRR